MGAIAISRKEEQQIEKLRKELGIPSKSGLIRVALKALEKKTDDERLRLEIEKSVRRCAAPDKKENQALFSAGVARHSSD